MSVQIISPVLVGSTQSGTVSMRTGAKMCLRVTLKLGTLVRPEPQPTLTLCTGQGGVRGEGRQLGSVTTGTL